MTLFTRAPGKVNRCLFLGATREDGLHSLVSVVQPVSLADGMRIEPVGVEDLVICPGVEGPNLVAEALAAFRLATGWDGPPVTIHVHKRVPVAAGMGGGSGDAAGALRLMSAISGLPLPVGVAMRLGADVPSQLEPHRCLMTGAGEHVRTLPEPRTPEFYVLVPSPHSLSTADVFREADRLGSPRTAEELEVLTAALLGPDLPGPLEVNDLEPAARSLCPPIGDSLDALRTAGASAAMVSGSGPTVYGVFADPDAAADAAASIAGAIAATPVNADFAAVYPRDPS